MEAVTKRINKLLDGDRLPPSTRKFLLSLRSWNEKRPLTTKQMSALTVIEERNLRPQNQNSVDEGWRKKYENDSKMKERMTVCAKYYDANPPYYSDLVFRVLNYSLLSTVGKNRLEKTKSSNERFLPKVPSSS